MVNVQYLPFGRFKWLTKDKIDALDLNTVRKDNPKDCIWEVDLECTKELLDLYHDYPLAPEQLRSKKVCYQTVTER